MSKVCVFSEFPVIYGGGIGIYKRKNECGEYEYTIYGTDHNNDTVEFLFSAIVQSIAAKKLACYNCSEYVKTLVMISQKLSVYFHMAGFKDRIYEIIKDLLNNGNIIDIGGIIKFRLKDMREDIEAYFDLIYYEYNLQKQYNDFVSLVKSYVSTEESKLPQIHIAFSGEAFVIYDNTMTNITLAALKMYRADTGQAEINLNDFLISTLLYFIPDTIVIHINDKSRTTRGDLRVIETIKNLFGDRALICETNGCELCGALCITNLKTP